MPWRGGFGRILTMQLEPPKSQEPRGAAKTRAKAHTPTQHTPARSCKRGSPGVQAKHADAHPNIPARSGGAELKPEPKHTHPQYAPKPGVAGHQWSAHTNTPTPQHPSREWRVAAKTGAKAHGPAPHTPARSCRAQAERAHKHAYPHTPARTGGAQPKPEPKQTPTGAQPNQEWRGTGGARTQTHTQPNNPANIGGAQSKPEPTRTHTHRTPQPGVAGYKRSLHMSAHTPQQPSKRGRGAAETRTRAHTPTPHTPARSGGVQAERARMRTHTATP